MSGQSQDTSPDPIYLEEIAHMAEHLSKLNTSTATLHKFVIRCLWSTAGRAGEVTWLSWDALNWDPHFKCVFVEVRRTQCY